MGRFDTTKATINANIKKNGNQEITGSILNSVMTEMVDATDAELAKLESKKAQIKVADNGNFFNIDTSLSYTDIDSNTGELKGTGINNVITSDFIVMDFSKEITTANNYPFIYCYAEDGSYLGLIRSAKAVVKETYPTTAKIRVNMFGDNARSVMVMYSDYYTGEYVPFNPVGGYTEVFEVATKDNFKKLDNKVITKGYIYQGSINIDTINKKIIVNSASANFYIAIDNGQVIATNLPNGQSFDFTPMTYYTIMYSISQNTILTKTDYVGDYSDYVVLAYIEKGKVINSMGVVLVDGSNRNIELDKKIISKGYIYRGSINIDTTNEEIVVNAATPQFYVITDNGQAISTGIASGTKFAGTKQNYYTIMYSISQNTILTKTDYVGDYSDYIVLAYVENKVILESMGVVLVDGKGAENDSSRLEAIERMTSANAQAIQTNATELDEESETRKNADDALSARIDNLVAPSGNSVAEITDARVGADGKTYTSLAARLNAEYGKVSNILTVGVGKMYQSIGAAINAANNGDIILIYRGIYEESILNRDKCVNLVGVSKDECILRYPSDDYPKPPLEMGMGIIENLTIHAYNNNTEATTQFGKGYCLHCDFYAHYQSNPPFSNYLYCRNVHFVNDNNEAVGIGLRPNFTIEFDSCTFETLSGDEACFYVHSSTNANTINAKCIVKNCTIVNNAANKETFRMDGYSFTNGGSTLVMQRNIVVNRGGGVKFAMHRYNYGTETGSNWQGVSDWLLDTTSMMNNVDECNS